MILVHSKYGIEMDIVENKISILVVENPIAFSQILTDLWNQSSGLNGNFILSDGDKIQSLSKDMDCIFQPFSLSCNDKRILTKLYKELNEAAIGLMQEETVFINSQIVNYLEKLLHSSSYPLTFCYDLDVVNLLKFYSVVVNYCEDSLLERVVEYMRVMHQLCGIKTFVFIHLKDYFTEEEIKNLYEFVFYEKIYLLAIESTYKFSINSEKYWILDKDLCIIIPE